MFKFCEYLAFALAFIFAVYMGREMYRRDWVNAVLSFVMAGVSVAAGVVLLKVWVV